MEQDNSEINKLRGEIDGIDNELIQLFEKRMEASMKIARYKGANRMPVRDGLRERELIHRVSGLVKPELEGYVGMLYNTILSMSRSYQNRYLLSPTPLAQAIQEAVNKKPVAFPSKAVVACQGSEGAYAQSACDKLFDMPSIMYFKTFEGVFQAVDKGMCQFGVLPLENNTAGSVNSVYNLLSKYNFYIVKSTGLRIDHTLIAPRGTMLSDVREVFSHEQALTQCSHFLETLGEVKLTPCLNTAIAAELVANSGRKDVAAIASSYCAELYNLSVLSYHVQNNENNRTRFICISKDLMIYPGADKSSLTLTLPHRPGALYDIMARFNALGINLLKLESRTIPGRDFEFMFYFDIEASIYSPEFVMLICELEQEVEQFRYLGSYIEMS